MKRITITTINKRERKINVKFFVPMSEIRRKRDRKRIIRYIVRVEPRRKKKKNNNNNNNIKFFL